MKFDCAIDKVIEIIENVILPAFSKYLFFLQYSYYYSVFYFLYFCIFVFDVFLFNLFLNLLHDSICGTMSSNKVCETKYKKKRLNKIK